MNKFKKPFVYLLFLLLLFGCSRFSLCETDRTKILLIGIDGATWQVIKPLVKEGKLSNISYLMREGVYGRLDSISPVVSAAIWTSIATGKGPEKHGILDWAFYSDTLKEVVPYRSYHRKTKAIWNILSENNKKVGVYSWPVTYPPERVNGFLIPHLYAYVGKGERIELPLTYPQGLASLLNTIPLYENSAKFEIDSQWEREYYSYYSLLLRDCGRIMWLEKEKPADFFAVYIRVMDGVQHLFWKFMEPEYFKDKFWGLTDEGIAEYKDVIKDFYRKIDGFIGELIKNIDAKTVLIIVSDHGFTRSELRNAKVLDFNKILEKSGLLEFKDSSGQIDYDRSQAWVQYYPAIGRLYYYVVINVVDKDSRHFKEVKDKIENLIQNICLSDGKRIFEVSGEETALDKLQKNKYDLAAYVVDTQEVASSDSFYIYKKGYQTSDFIIQPDNKEIGFISGRHDEHDGIIIIYDKSGKRVVRGETVNDASILDIAPTILYLMGLPIGKDMDGKVLTAAIEPLYMKKNHVRFVKTYEERALLRPYYKEEDINRYDEELSKKLKTLGYMQ